MTDESGSEERQYDALGNVVVETKTLPPMNNNKADTYTTAFQYDTWNRMMNMTYPDGEQVKEQGQVSKYQI